MRERPIVLVVMHPWHATQSSAFHDLAVADLIDLADVREAVWPVTDAVPSDVRAVVCCQVLPPFQWIEAQSSRVVWVPMWDDVSGHPDAWWHELPKRLKVVAFSGAVAARARGRSRGLRAALLQGPRAVSAGAVGRRARLALLESAGDDRSAVPPHAL